MSAAGPAGSPIWSRRQLVVRLAAGAAVAAGGLGSLAGCRAAAEEPAPEPRSQRLPRSPLADGYARLYRDLRGNWWDSSGRVLPARALACVIPPGGDVARWGLPAIGRQPALWMEETYHNFLFWHWRATRSAETAGMIASQWECTRAQFAPAMLAGDGRGVTINASDDAGWVAQYLLQVFAVTRDRMALDAARAMIPATLARFRDPFTDPVALPAFSYSRQGILYALPGGDPDGQGIASTYEVTLALAALDLFGATRERSWLDYAAAVYGILQTRFRRPDGTYWNSVTIDPRSDHYLRSPQDYFGPPQPGIAAIGLQGSLPMGVLAARLRRATGRAAYAADAAAIARAMLRPDTFVQPSTNGHGTVFLNVSDAWTGAFWITAFATEVLPLPGVDPDGAWKAMLGRTARSILSQRVEGGFYGADWGGVSAVPNANGNRSYEEAAAKADGGAGQANARQIMTSSNSAMVVQAAMMTGA